MTAANSKINFHFYIFIPKKILGNFHEITKSFDESVLSKHFQYHVDLIAQNPDKHLSFLHCDLFLMTASNKSSGMSVVYEKLSLHSNGFYKLFA